MRPYTLTCRDLHRLGLEDFADHDPCAIGPQDAKCFCYEHELPGQLRYEEVQGCRAVKEIEISDGFCVALCCACGDAWHGTDAELAAVVDDALTERAIRRFLLETPRNPAVAAIAELLADLVLDEEGAKALGLPEGATATLLEHHGSREDLVCALVATIQRHNSGALLDGFLDAQSGADVEQVCRLLVEEQDGGN